MERFVYVISQEDGYEQFLPAFACRNIEIARSEQKANQSITVIAGRIEAEIELVETDEVIVLWIQAADHVM